MQIRDSDKYYTEVFNHALYQLDPMHTGSVENELEDEYLRIAESIATQLAEGVELREAVANEIEFWFGEERNSEKVELITKRLADVLASESMF